MYSVAPIPLCHVQSHHNPDRQARNYACSYTGKLRATPEATGREDAAMLTAALEEALPVGALAAKYRVPARSGDEAAAAYANLLQMRADFQLVDVTLRECTRLVAAECAERAAAVEAVRSAPWRCGARAWHTRCVLVRDTRARMAVCLFE